MDLNKFPKKIDDFKNAKAQLIFCEMKMGKGNFQNSFLFNKKNLQVDWEREKKVKQIKKKKKEIHSLMVQTHTDTNRE